MKRLNLIALLLGLSLGLTFGQKDSVSIADNDLKHSLGVGAGFTTGVGMSYRYTINKIKVQLTFAPIKDDYSTKIHTGLTALYKMVDTDKADFYLYQGNYFFYEKIKDSNGYHWPYNEEDMVRKVWNHGLGIGIEFTILKRVGFNLMGGYAGYNGFHRIGLTGETGLYYMF